MPDSWLEQRYAKMVSHPDPAARRIAEAQLTRLRRSSAAPSETDCEGDAPAGLLASLVERAVGPLRCRPSGDLEGQCPWHGSQSGRCLVIFAGGQRWWCRSCRRGGDAAAWVALNEGVSFPEARRRLGLPVGTAAQRVRPTLHRQVGS